MGRLLLVGVGVGAGVQGRAQVGSLVRVVLVRVDSGVCWPWGFVPWFGLRSVVIVVLLTA